MNWNRPCDESSVVIVDKNGIPLTQNTQDTVLEQVSSLPASQPEVVKDYVKMIADNPISIIRAETGAGKTTQIPKNVRLQTGQKTNVTQPRVLSAISNATRVAQELLCQTEKTKYTLGYDEIWYRTWVDVSSKRSAALSFNTGGLEMMRQFYSWLHADITFLDEIQGFWLDLEILMWLFKTRNDLSKRLVIMSATIDPDVFIDYFWNQFGEIPILDIPGRTYPVEHFYYKSHEEFIPITSKLLAEWKSGVIFVSWKSELYDYVQKFTSNGLNIPVYPLHAELTEAEQMQAIVNPEREQRLIIATNVAEESITPEWIQFVIDLWKHKVSYPNSFGIEELIKEDISKANSLQRAGRAGRMEDGEYHRFHRENLDDVDPYPVPPMSKQMLDREILLFLHQGMDLADLDRQSKSKWERLFSHEINTCILPIAYSRLEHIWAINNSGKITPLGRDLLSMNLDVYHARMIIQSFYENCTEEMIYLVCILSAKGFLSTDDKWKELFGATYHKQTDVLYHMKMFTDFTSRKLSRQYTNKLAGMWIDYRELEEFHLQEWPVWDRKMFFEIVDLSPIGIKNYKLAEIHNLVFVIQKRILSMWRDIDTTSVPKFSEILKNGKRHAIQTCLYSGAPFFMSRYDNKKERFVSNIDQWGIGDLEFQLAKTSLVSPSPTKDYVFYPFILELDGDKDSLYLASFVSEVESWSEKRAHEVNERHVSLLPWKKARKKVPSIEGIPELEDRYIELLQDVSKIWGESEFLETILPFMLLIHNHKFKWFVERNPEKIDQMIQRLVRFLKKNSWDYLHRINLKDLSRIEASFKHDSSIYGDFYAWESRFVSATKKQTRATDTMRLSPKKRNDLYYQQELVEMRKRFISLVWGFNSWSYNIDTSAIKKGIVGGIFEELEMNNASLNAFIIDVQNYVEDLDAEETKAVCAKLSRRRKQKIVISKYRKYMRYLSNIETELQKLLDWEESVDGEFLIKFVESKFFQKQSRSQKDKFKLAVTRVLGVSKRKLSAKDRESHQSKLVKLCDILGQYNESLDTKDDQWKAQNKNRIRRVNHLIETISKIVDGSQVMDNAKIQELQDNNFHGCFNHDASEIPQYIRILSQLSLGKNDVVPEKKLATAKKQVEQFRNSISSEYKNKDLDLSVHIKSYEEYDIVPEAWELSFSLGVFLQEIFSSEYFNEKISEKDISEIITEIYRNNVQKDHSMVDIVMKYLIFHKHADHLMHKDLRTYISQEQVYGDTKYAIQTSYIWWGNYEIIKWIQDKQEFSQIIVELENKMDTLRKAKKKIASMKKQ